MKLNMLFSILVWPHPLSAPGRYDAHLLLFRQGALFLHRAIELTFSKEGRPARAGPGGWRPTPDIAARLAFWRHPSSFHLLSTAETDADSHRHSVPDLQPTNLKLKNELLSRTFQGQSPP